MSSIYKCIVEGEYFEKEAGGKVLKHYTLEFNVPNLGVSALNIQYMSLIKQNLLQKQLKIKYPKALTFRTYELVSKTELELEPESNNPNISGNNSKSPPFGLDNHANVEKMTKSELVNHIKEYAPEIDLEIYNTIEKMISAYRNYDIDKSIFIKKQGILKKERELKKTLDQLNPNHS